MPKPSIAAVQGKCIAGGLLLCWPCDLIVAADNAEFSDPVVFMGIGGVEYHGHTWELGAAQGQGDPVHRAGGDRRRRRSRWAWSTGWCRWPSWTTATMELARQIAQMHPFALRQAKRAVNQTLDIQGFYAAIQSVFDIHHTGHGNALSVGGYPILIRAEEMKERIASQ